jgi:hypothetical protein
MTEKEEINDSDYHDPYGVLKCWFLKWFQVAILVENVNRHLLVHGRVAHGHPVVREALPLPVIVLAAMELAHARSARLPGSLDSVKNRALDSEDGNLMRVNETEKLGVCLSEHWMVGCKS